MTGFFKRNFKSRLWEDGVQPNSLAWGYCGHLALGLLLLLLLQQTNALGNLMYRKEGNFSQVCRLQFKDWGFLLVLASGKV